VHGAPLLLVATRVGVSHRVVHRVGVGMLTAKPLSSAHAGQEFYRFRHIESAGLAWKVRHSVARLVFHLSLSILADHIVDAWDMVYVFGEGL